ncbi:DNA mismatch repair protein MutT [Pseudomonas sp. HMWF032]|uniref:NUDIX hydrolase n=1 Tax=unclassified Pseudomonas TaxID=196821 RepID=UPI000D342DD8|nr:MULTISPECIES: NUDIX domain-containing protein [unclassified Pseudomonas]PTS86522.1 DNA mismatch repair protein MutT [Pseudomonas sp. HMWF032]PTT81423.1 DNA mismatch repair protein MutT [Pseudomonas sp. HMWF010]WAC44185.1 NUDIX domain-containing protein [Pseudomonas sp. SL4(2022)]
MSPDKACPVILSSARPYKILLFRHPLAGVQLVKGSIKKGETPGVAALRELTEESGISDAVIENDLGVWDSEHLGQVWSFQLCQVERALPERWSHQTVDDYGHLFEFYWASLENPPHDECHPVFQRALAFLRTKLNAPIDERR